MRIIPELDIMLFNSIFFDFTFFGQFNIIIQQVQRISFERQMKQFPNQRLFQEKWQAILGEKLDKPGVLKKSCNTGRLPVAQGDFTGLLLLENLRKKTTYRNKNKNLNTTYLMSFIFFLSFENFLTPLFSTSQ